MVKHTQTICRFLQEFKLFHATGLFLYSLKISENLWFSGNIKTDQWHEMNEYKK